MSLNRQVVVPPYTQRRPKDIHGGEQMRKALSVFRNERYLPYAC